MRRPGRTPPQWAGSSSNIAEPLTGKAALGYLPDEIPPAAWFNYHFNQLGQWTGFLAGPSQNVWTPRVFPDPSTGLVRGDYDGASADDTEARYRYAVVGEDGTGPFIAVSRRGTVWVTRRNLPATPGTPLGICFSPDPWQWVLWTDTSVFLGPADRAIAYSPLREAVGGWYPESLPASPGTIAGVAGYFNDYVASTSTKILVRSSGAWSGLTIGTRQAGRDVVWTRTALVEISSTGGSGVIHTAGDPLGTWANPATLAGVGVGTTWRLALGDAGTVVAFKTGVDVPEVWRSTDHGATWAAITTPASLKQLTALRWHDGVWIATSTVAPYAQTSGDLEHWLALPIPVGESGNELRDVVFGGGSWLLVSRSGVLQGAPAVDPGSEGYTPGTTASIPGNAGWLRGVKISLTAPTDGQVLVYDAGLDQYVPETPTATGAPSGTGVVTVTSGVFDTPSSTGAIVNAGISQLVGSDPAGTAIVSDGAGGAQPTSADVSALLAAADAAAALGVLPLPPFMLPLTGYATSTGPLTAVAWVTFDPALYAITGKTTVITLETTGLVSAGGLTGTVTLRNLTASSLAATIPITATTPTTQTASVPLPTVATVYELRLSLTGTGYVACGAILRITWS